MAREAVPDSLALLWLCQYAPSSSSYAPFYIKANDVPKAYSRYGVETGDRIDRCDETVWVAFGYTQNALPISRMSPYFICNTLHYTLYALYHTNTCVWVFVFVWPTVKKLAPPGTLTRNVEPFRGFHCATETIQHQRQTSESHTHTPLLYHVMHTHTTHTLRL